MPRLSVFSTDERLGLKPRCHRLFGYVRGLILGVTRALFTHCVFERLAIPGLLTRRAVSNDGLARNGL
ncbi:MAG: hypothetical protein NXI31_04130 [bacterium]|nr:hypothetical protein [bacterium]